MAPDTTTATPSGADLSKRQAWAMIAAAILALAAGIALYGWRVDFAGDILAVELSGADQEWPPRADGLRAALFWDFALIAGYGTCLLLLADLARRLFWTRTARRLARVALACSWTAIAADVVENVLLLGALEYPGNADGALWLAAGAAALKFSVLVVAAPIAVASLCTTVFRLLWNRGDDQVAAVPTRCPATFEDDERDDVAAAVQIPAQPTDTPEGDEVGQVADEGPPAPVTARERWRAGYRVPGLNAEMAARASAREAPARLGFCVSGGGIRSASVAMGALQGLRAQLLEARYLASVSGGGYTAGALQMALQPVPQSRRPGVASPADVFLPGTPEEDHVRRHSSYIADGAGQWLLALGVVLRGLLASLLLVTAAVSAVGVLLGLFYGLVPIAPDVEALAPRNAPMDTPLPALSDGMAAALAVTAALAGVCWLGSLVALRGTGQTWRRGRSAAVALTGLLVLLATLGIGVPALVWASAAVLDLPDVDVATAAGAGGGGTILLTYVAALAAMAWRRREAIGQAVGRFRKKGTGGAQAVPRGVVQQLAVGAVVTLLAAVFLLVLGSVVSTAADWVPDGAKTAGDWEPVVLLGVAVAVLALLGGAVDQTWLGLHPFYRRRLASAFAVRRTAAGTAEPYDYAAERTALSAYGERRPGFPELVFCGAANLSGQEHAPPGRRAVSFTMTSSWLGGPDVGYVATKELEDAVSEHLALDLTVQAAVAVSGAAFASAMGRHARAAQTLLALTNARLGTWLPNPAFVSSRKQRPSWTTPGLPALRRVTYLLREIVGVYPADERLLYVTDGGHYENLALVELLRRRCTEIICIDASGDRPPLAGTLGEAISLAYEELGVRIELDGIRDLVAGSATPLDPAEPLSALNGRLARSAVARGRIVYPEESGLPEHDRTGTIYFAKAVLTPDLPYDVLTYAVRNEVFPHDSTGDQWFDTGQFNNYLELGRRLAVQVEASQAAAAVVEDALDGVYDRST